MLGLKGKSEKSREPQLAGVFWGRLNLRLGEVAQRHVHAHTKGFTFVPVLEPQPDSMSNGAAVLKTPTR